jgi:competence protein ComEC
MIKHGCMNDQRTHWRFCSVNPAARLRHRLLCGLAYYPLLVLLLIVLALIHATQWLGLPITLALLVLGWSSFWWSQLYAPNPLRLRGTSVAVPMGLMWMCLIAIAFCILHNHQIHQTRRELQQWNQANVNDSQEFTSDQAWNPVVAQGTIEQTLRYRRATIPGLSHADTEPLDDWQTLSVIKIKKIQTSDSWQELSLVASLVIHGRKSGLFPGDCVQLYGHWRRPPSPSNPGQFDLRNRYAELGIAAQLKSQSPDSVLLIDSGSALRLDRWLAIWTHHALIAIDRFVSWDQAPLTAALVLGQREQADWQFQEQMLQTGTIHMLSISGMHIEMVALSLLLSGWMLFLPKGPVLLGTVCICALYALLCGANPPVARATIMLSAACLARFLGWPSNSLNILALAGLLILSVRTSVAFEVGTQLSFLTVSVLILTFPLFRHRSLPIQRLIESKETSIGKSMRFLRGICLESIRSSFWVSFLSAPLVWHSFHIISPISIALNLILWMPMLVALLSGLGLILFFWCPPLAWICGTACGAALWSVSAVVHVAAQVPFGHFWAASPPDWWLIGFYTIAFSVSVWLGTKRQVGRRTLLWTLGGWFALGPTWLLSHETLARNNWLPNASELKATFIDVGHGTCVLIQTPDHKNWLYDAGRLGDHQRSYQPIAQALWAMDVGKIDGLFLSHADADHYNAMAGIIDRFDVQRFITTEYVQRHPSKSLQALLDKVRHHQIPIDLWKSNSTLDTNANGSLTAIYPTQERGSDFLASSSRQVSTSGRTKKGQPKPISDNANSLCLVIQFANRKILLPGDLEDPGTEILTAQPPIRVDVLMAPHHGSTSTKPDGLIQWCQPSSVVISGSHRSLTPKVFQVYSPDHQYVVHTAKDHALQIRIQRDGTLLWTRWNDNRWQAIQGSKRTMNQR